MKFIFETLVEKLYFDILTEVAKAAFAGTLDKAEQEIPLKICPGPNPIYRDTLEAEREIVRKRIAIILNKDKSVNNIINVIPEACDQCPMCGYIVTNTCRGCLGHACLLACSRHAIRIDENHRAQIDKTKCVNCGACARVCPFGSIHNFRRPCQNACSTGAIAMDNHLAAKIDYEKCISCGSCLQKCPFGAITDKLQFIEVIEELKQRTKDRQEGKKEKPFFCILAPSIAAQAAPNTIEQTVEALLQLGFTNVTEAALGADIVAWNEAQELVEKKMLTSSCCPAFVSFIVKAHPELKNYVSHNFSPMMEIAKQIRKQHPDAKICFFGPCTAKKKEITLPDRQGIVDYVLTFAELRALFNAQNIDLDKLQGKPLDEATQYGRGFAKCGGLSEAVKQALVELENKDFKLCPVSCNGMADCIRILNRLSAGDKTYNFVEGMVCEGGCVGGPLSLTHKNLVANTAVETHGQKSSKKTIKATVKKYTSK